MMVLKSEHDVLAIRALFEARSPASRDVRALRCVATPGLEEPGRTFSLCVPGSKSLSNRALVLAAMSQDAVHLEGLLFADDVYWGLLALVRLGMEVELDAQSCSASLRWLPDESRSRLTASDDPLHLGMAGTLARFLPAVILTMPEARWRSWTNGVPLDGAQRLRQRPLTPLVAALRQWGARIEGDALPIRIYPSLLKGNTFISGSESGQFFSGLILAASGAQHPVTIERTEGLVQPDYVRMTIAAARAFGAEVEADADLNHVRCHPVPRLGPAQGRYTIEADASTACYFFALAVMFDLDLTVSNIGSTSLQPDLGFVGFLQKMGASFEVKAGSVRHCPRGHVRLQGGFSADFGLLSDQALTAGVLAVMATAPISISGVAHIRKHESDRIHSLVTNLKALGVEAHEQPDGFTVCPWAGGCGSAAAEGALPNKEPTVAARRRDLATMAGVWPTHGDHRFAMTGALLSLWAPGVVVADPFCCEKTAPAFFQDLERLGVVFSSES